MDAPDFVTQLWILALGALIAVTTVHLINIVFPYRLPRGVSDAQLDAVARQMRGVTGGLVLVSVGAGAVAAVALVVILCGISLVLEAFMPAHDALFRGVGGEPQYHIWVAPAVVLAAVWTIWFHHTLCLLCLGRATARARQVVSERSSGVNKRKFFLVATALVVPACLIYVLLALDWYVRFEPERVVVNDFWAFGERAYGYDEVKAVVQTSHSREPNGEEGDDPQVHVLFADGRRWSATSTDDTNRVIRHIIFKTGLPLETPRLIEDLATR